MPINQSINQNTFL